MSILKNFSSCLQIKGQELIKQTVHTCSPIGIFGKAQTKINTQGSQEPIIIQEVSPTLAFILLLPLINLLVMYTNQCPKWKLRSSDKCLCEGVLETIKFTSLTQEKKLTFPSVTIRRVSIKRNLIGRSVISSTYVQHCWTILATA